MKSCEIGYKSKLADAINISRQTIEPTHKLKNAAIGAKKTQDKINIRIIFFVQYNFGTIMIKIVIKY